MLFLWLFSVKQLVQGILKAYTEGICVSRVSFSFQQNARSLALTPPESRTTYYKANLLIINQRSF